MSRIEDTCRETLMMESKGHPPSTMRRVSESMVQAQIRRLESHIAALRAENERLRDYKEDVENAVKMSLDEVCTADEKHCTCVPLLRQEVKLLKKDKRELVEALEALYQHTKNNYQICGLNEKVKAAVEKHKEGK